MGKSRSENDAGNMLGLEDINDGDDVSDRGDNRAWRWLHVP